MLEKMKYFDREILIVILSEQNIYQQFEDYFLDIRLKDIDLSSEDENLEEESER